MVTFKQEDKLNSFKASEKLGLGLTKQKYGLSSVFKSAEGKNNSTVTQTIWSIIDLTPAKMGSVVGTLVEHFHNYQGKRCRTQRTGNAFGIPLTPEDIEALLWFSTVDEIWGESGDSAWFSTIDSPIGDDCGDFSSQVEMYEHKHGV